MASTLFHKIYQIIRRIPKGKVATYGQIAALVGKPRAARSVGWALHSYRGDDIPWHRVINSRGTSSFPEETKRQLQQALLEAEGIAFNCRGVIELEIYLWDGR